MLIEKLETLEALLAAMTGSQGISEISESQTQALVNAGFSLAHDALELARTASKPL